ncbi:hypothetical protein JYU34_012774 [Plutella xylostella]|uniref:RING-type E3 ubiquitin transferase n=1 Tax=Plutella xylostella TaxID=51655 RepID=A0ABQ7QC40_PLUXY|nr:hypothetical protein JYU34_012774 [Plutella xylostella]
MSDSQTNDNSSCVVCFKTVLYYSIGECDHPVCFECSTRMRVLCLQNECPICRQALARVVFTDTVLPYKELRNRAFSDKLFERQYKIAYCSEEIKNAYTKLLENQCNMCENLAPFRSFSALSDHMRKVHERYYCDLCVKHLKIFTSERKCYTRQELAHHRRKGDLDDTSHRGHPLCEFCEERFMDADELYRHLRKEHLYCHLCDADGRNHYYASHSALAHHFRTEHYLCEEGECAGQHLTAVFRSEIDLKAHKASIHGAGLTRGAARQARTLELQFNITPHAVTRHQGPRDRERERDRDRERERDWVGPEAPTQAPPPRIDTRSNADFPSLSSAAPAPLLRAAPHTVYKSVEGLTRTDKNFPALSGSGGGPSRPAPPPARAPAPVAATLLRNAKPSVSIQLHSQPASASNFRLTQPTGNRISIPQQRKQPISALSDDDFPSLGVARDDHPSIGAGTVQPAKVTLINSNEMQALKKNQSQQQKKKPPLSSEAFPALSSGPAPAAPAQWVKVSKQKDKAKPARSEPVTPREPSFNPVADFPTLPVNNTKPKAKKVAPAPQLPTSQPEPKNPSKKEKKKNNNKKENLVETNFSTHEQKPAREMAQVLANINNNSSPDDNKVKLVEAAEKNMNGGTGDFALAAQEYPPLRKGESSKRPNGSVKPPPGFKPRPACDGLTFTNSAGQSFPAPLHSYIPPPNFENRNRALVKKFAAALGSAPAMEEFKSVSRAFRDSLINADEFYNHCRRSLGSQFEGLFLELIALLPDIAKQQELVVGRGAAARLAVCATCGQLLAPPDQAPHDAAHWPPLSSR